MKWLLTIVLICVVPFSFVSAQEPDPINQFLHGSVRYDEGLVGSFGYVTHAAGPLYIWTYGDFGTYAAINVEAAALWKVPGLGFYAGPVIGPNFDWEYDHGDGLAAVSYILGASGLAVAWPVNDKFGLTFQYVYNFSLENDNLVVDGWRAGIGAYIPL